MNLKNKFISGLKWNTLGNVFQQIMQVLSVIVLARILTPDDYGTFSILMIVIGFMGMLAGVGTSAAIIQTESPSNNLLSTIFIFNVVFSLFIYLIIYFLSYPISIFFENPEIEVMLQLISLVFIIKSVTSVQSSLLHKNLQFKKIITINILSSIIGFLIAVWVALKGMGVYSLIVKLLVESIVSTAIILFIVKWMPRTFFSIIELRKVLSYASNLTTFTIINYFSRSADNILIGKYLNASSLGVYSMAYTIMLYPLRNISHTIVRVLFPVLSQIKDDDEKIRRAYKKVIFFIALVTFPLMSGLMGLSDIFVSVVFGDKWSGLSTLLFILAPIGMMQSIVTTVGSLYMAKGTVKTMLRIGTLNAILTVLSFVVGISFGVEGVAIAYLIINIIMFYPNLKIAWKQIGLSVREGIHDVIPIFIFSIVLYFSLIILSMIVNEYIGNLLLQFFILVISGALVYLTLLKIYYGSVKDLFKELKSEKN